VYAGIPRYRLRVRNNDSRRLEHLAAGIEIVHAAGKAFYLVSIVLPHNARLKTFIGDGVI
jgi:putative protease